ncbi:MAG: hypothetical protein ACOWWR_08485 [Eubacteriales bacterium]
MNIKQLQEERNQIFSDFWNNITPKRLPVSVGMYHHIVIEYAKKDIMEVQYDYTQLANTSDRICQILYSDTCPISGGGTPNFAFYNAILNSQCFVMSAKGFVQHPEVVGMLENEYDEFLADPYAFMIEKVVPRQYKSLSLQEPVKRAHAMKIAMDAKDKDSMDFSSLSKPLIEKYGYYVGAPKGSVGTTRAPYDFLADLLRSFSGISTDLRRNRSKVVEATEALYPFMFNMGLVANPQSEGQVRIPLHMPTFMREKDFVEVYMPSFLRLIQEYASLGIRTSIFCEDDWTRYLDILQEFPAGTLLRFEYGDAKLFKEKLGKKFFIGGFFPTQLITTGSKQQCIDKIKELLDIMMPGGGYVFDFDKRPLVAADVNIDNLTAVTEYIRDHAFYDKPGQPFGQKLNSEGFTCDIEKSSHYDSKYKFSWEEFKANNPYAPDIAKGRLEDLDNKMMKWYLSLLS